MKDLQEANKIISAERWIFLVLILVTVMVPQIIAAQYNTDFIFGYPIGDEYQTAKSIAAIFAIVIILGFLKKETINIHPALKVLIVILAIMPFFRLAVASLLFLTDQTRAKPSFIKYFSWHGIRDALVLGIGFYSIYLFIIGLSGLIFYSSTESALMNLSRMAVSGIVFYLVLKRKNYVTHANIIEYLILVIMMFYFLL